MKITVTTKELGDIFDRAHDSLWKERNVAAIEVPDQIAFWRDRFNARIYGGHFDEYYKNPDIEDRSWNTEDAIIEFDSENDYVLFLLKWI